MTSENLDTSVTEDVTVEQAEQQPEPTGKNFSQEDLDRIVAERLTRERQKIEKRYQGVDVDQYQKFVSEQENRELEAKKKRGEFEKILEDTVTKKDRQIQELRNQIHSVKVTGALLSAASQHRAVNAEQVSQLLQSGVQLNADGEVEVLDQSGTPRYDDAGKLLSVDQYVSEWLSANPHFVAATPGGSGSRSRATIDNTTGVPDIGKLDMTKRSDREIYKKIKLARHNS